jgi:hypothetical protein
MVTAVRACVQPIARCTSHLQLSYDVRQAARGRVAALVETAADGVSRELP